MRLPNHKPATAVAINQPATRIVCLALAMAIVMVSVRLLLHLIVL